VDDRDDHEKSERHFDCESCDIKFSYFSDLQKHRKDPKCKAYICPICGRNFQDPKDNKSWFRHKL